MYIVCRIYCEKCWVRRNTIRTNMTRENINNFRYTDEITLITGNKDDLRNHSLRMETCVLLLNGKTKNLKVMSQIMPAKCK